MIKHGFVLCSIVSVFFSFSCEANSLQNPLSNFDRCYINVGANEIDAECATLTRPENPNKPNGKTIDLFVAKLPSLSPSPAADAFTIIQGGPGGSSVDLAINFKAFLDIVRAKRDVIVIDQRGTGRSNKLNCDIDSNESATNSFDPIITAKLTRDCIAKLTQHDLGAYTTSVAVQDLEALRMAAGYQQLSLYGVSYGTRVAQHYLRRFPQQTRTIIIDGVVDIGLNLAGAEIALRSQNAFDQMVKRCNETASCVSQFGNIKQQFKSLRQRLKSQTIKVTVAHPNTGEKQAVTLTESTLLIAVRLMPYSTESLSLLPLLINSAFNGNYTPLATQSITDTDNLTKGFAIGMHNSVMCTEDTPFVASNAAEQTKNTYFGSLMVDSMRITCQLWPKGIIDDDFLEPFESDVPVLILSGETDPITPPANGERAASMFQNSKHIIVPAHGHGVVGRGCVPFLVNDFLDDTNLDTLKTDCIKREHALPFFINTSGPKP